MTDLSALKASATSMLATLGLQNLEFDEYEAHGGGMLATFQCRYPIQRVTDWTIHAKNSQIHADTHPGMFVLDSRNPAAGPEVYSHSYCGSEHAIAIQGVVETVRGVRKVAGSLWIGAGRSAPREVLQAFDQMSRKARAEQLLDDIIKSAESLLASGQDILPEIDQKKLETLWKLAAALDDARSPTTEEAA